MGQESPSCPALGSLPFRKRILEDLVTGLQSIELPDRNDLPLCLKDGIGVS